MSVSSSSFDRLSVIPYCIVENTLLCCISPLSQFLSSENVIMDRKNDWNVDRKKDEIPQQWNYSFVLGYDFYHYTKTFWIHSWASIMPFHLETGEYSYHEFIGSKQTWVDLGAGFILGYRLNKHLGVFMEGKYNKYWNRQWHDFSVGLNYIIF